MSNNVVQMNKTTDIKALYNAIPTFEVMDVVSPEANTFFNALAMMEPAARDEAIASCNDILLADRYRTWLAAQD